MSRPVTTFKIDKQMLDLYSDYLITSFSSTTATGMARLVEIPHDSISRFLGGVKYDKTGDKIENHEFTSKDLWSLVKPAIRNDETEDGVVIIDDTVEEKQYSGENDVICWHFDHCFGRNVKGINLLNFVYVGNKLVTPIAFEVIKKTEMFESTVEILDKDKQPTGKFKTVQKRRSTKTKNELAQNHIKGIIKNKVKFKYFLMDIWFACNETLELINSNHKSYVVPLKSNRKLTTSLKDKKLGKWIKLDNTQLNQELEDSQRPIEIWLEGLDHSILLMKKVFTNKDGSIGTMYLVTNDKTLQNQDKSEIYKIYQKRWKIEEFHKSIKSNLNFATSPTKTVTTQINHFFCSIYSYFKLELLTKTTTLKNTIKNHFQLKAKLYLSALKSSNQELARLKQLVSCDR
jgi:DDE superfamily endonuclease